MKSNRHKSQVTRDSSAPAPRVVIVGRPNVGKSSLFNRLFGRRRALVHDLPGVTRDRLEEETYWTLGGADRRIVLVDTGGVGGDSFRAEVDLQVQTAVTEATVILFVVDARAGLMPHDQEVLAKLHRMNRGTPVICVVNKVDDLRREEEFLADFYSLNLKYVLPASAEHNLGVETLKEMVYELGLPKTEPKVGAETESDSEDSSEESESHDDILDAAAVDEAEGTAPAKEEAPRIPQIAIVGRPNVGKSTLINALTGENRMITSPIAGTTVDAIDSLVNWNGREFVFIDTAGIRRKSKTEKGVEVLSVVQTRKALERCDVALLLIDAEEGVSDQDEKIGGLIEEVGCGVIVVVNKWDLFRNQKLTEEAAAAEVRERMAFLRYAPIIFISAVKSRGLDDIPALIEEIIEGRKVKVATHEFTEWVRNEAAIHNPKGAKFFLCHQSGRHPPTFVCHVNDPKRIHFTLERYLLNAIRDRWGFMGSPVRILFKN